MKKSVVAAAVVIVLGAAAVAAVPIVERHAASEIKHAIERSGTTKVDQVEVSLFDRRIRLLNLSSSSGGSTMTIARWEASGLAWPLAELLRGRTPLGGFQFGDPLQAEHLELERVDVAEPAGTGGWSIGSLAIDGLDLARFDASGVPDGPYRPAILMARAMAALDMRRLEERNAVFSLPTGDTIGLKSIVLENFDRGKVASAMMAGLEATAKDGQAPLYRVAEINAGNIDMSRMIAALSAPDWVPGASVGRMTVGDASASGFGGRDLEKYGISLASASMKTVQDGDGVGRTRIRLEGFVLAPPLRGLEALKLRLGLQTMGLKEVKADFDCSLAEDRAKGEAMLDSCALAGPGLGEIRLSGRIVDADPAFWRAIDTGAALSLAGSNAALASAQLVLADKSLLERGLRALASATGQPVSAARSNLARDVRRYQPAGVLISQSLTQLLDTVARFIEQGGMLTIDAKPQPPLAFDRLERLAMPGADLVRMLGLSASLTR